jgi:hypothetical protein
MGSVLVGANTDPIVMSSEFTGDELYRARETLPMTDLEDIGLAAGLLDEVRQARGAE